MVKRYGFAIAACARWEADSIVEWIQYHKFIGFDHFFIYCNDDDPSVLYEILLPFIDSEIVTFYYYSIKGQQEAMLSHFMRVHAHSCDWFGFFDIDEFLLIRHYDHVGKFIATLPFQFDAIHINQLDAGHNGHGVRPIGSVIENFTRRSRYIGGFTKCLARGEAFDEARLGAAFRGAWWHNIAIILKPGSRVVNVLNIDMSEYYFDLHSNWDAMQTEQLNDRIIDTAVIYHISMKSEGDMLRRVARGTSGQFGGQERWKIISDQGRSAILAHLAPLNEVEENRLVSLRRKMLGQADSKWIIRPCTGVNLAPNGRAMQSSVATTSIFQDIKLDAAGVISGYPNGAHSHHTETEADPWWYVEFEELIEVREIRIFNRVDASRGRFRNFRIAISADGHSWHTVLEKNDDLEFGGIDGCFFSWYSDSYLVCRFVRIMGYGHSHIDLDQVEIY